MMVKCTVYHVAGSLGFLCKIKGKSEMFKKRVKWPGIALGKINLTAMVTLNQTENGWNVGKHCPLYNLMRT